MLPEINVSVPPPILFSTAVLPPPTLKLTELSLPILKSFHETILP
jgi:hypothetical protein